MIKKLYMKKIIKFNNKILTYYEITDFNIKKILKKNENKIFFTSRKNFKIVLNYLKIRNKLNPEQKFLYLLENLETKDYNDYPVYLFFYGKKLIYKEFFKKYIIKGENKSAVTIINKKIERLIKHKSNILVTFDNFHLIKFKNPKAKLFYYKDAEKIYSLEGKYLWINLSVSDTVRYLNFNRLKIFGLIYDPFTIWKLSFLNDHDFDVI